MQQLLWIETLVKLALGLALILAPRVAIRLAGLPDPGKGFWLRLLGGVLVGLAGAAFLEAKVAGAHGIGPAGLIVINLSVASVLGAQLIMKAGPVTARGKVLLWFAFAFLLVLSLIELAYA